VDARLVGRAWYVNLASLEDHRNNKYKTTVRDVKSSEISSKKASGNYLSRIDVEPVLKNKTVKIFREKNGELAETAVRYEKDDYSLKIKTTEKKFNVTDFKAGALPEVYLSGSIKVDGIPEAIESNESEEGETSKRTDISSNIKPELQSGTSRIVSIRQPKRKSFKAERSDIKRIVQIKNRPIPIKKQPEEAVVTQTDFSKIQLKKQFANNKESVQHETVISRPRQSLDIKRPTSFSPDVILEKTTQKTESKTTSGSFIYVAVVIFLLAAISSFLVLVTVREVTVQNGFYTDKITFDFQILRTLFEIIFK
jgi:hypothetical protein